MYSKALLILFILAFFGQQSAAAPCLGPAGQECNLLRPSFVHSAHSLLALTPGRLLGLIFAGSFALGCLAGIFYVIFSMMTSKPSSSLELDEVSLPPYHATNAIQNDAPPRYEEIFGSIDEEESLSQLPPTYLESCM